MNTAEANLCDRAYGKRRILRKLGMLDPRIPRIFKARALRWYRENKRVNEASRNRRDLPDGANALARELLDGDS